MIADYNSKNVRYPSQLAIFLMLTAGGLVIGSMASLAVWSMMTGQSFPTNANDILQPKYYNVNMVMQAITTFFIFFMPAHFFAMICYRKPYDYLGYNSRINYRQILVVIGILVLTFPLSGALATINKMIPIPEDWAAKFKAAEAAREAQEAALIKMTSFSKYLISLLVIALLPAIFEETFFRGGMQNFLARWFKGPWAAIILTSIIFSIVHLSYYGFFVRLALGIILGLVFYYSGNLWLNILFHFLFNAVQVTILYIMTLKGIKIKNIEENFPVWMGMIALILLYGLFKYFKRISEKENAKFNNEDDDEFDFTNTAKNS